MFHVEHFDSDQASPRHRIGGIGTGFAPPTDPHFGRHELSESDPADLSGGLGDRRYAGRPCCFLAGGCPGPGSCPSAVSAIASGRSGARLRPGRRWQLSAYVGGVVSGVSGGCVPYSSSARKGTRDHSDHFATSELGLWHSVRRRPSCRQGTWLQAECRRKSAYAVQVAMISGGRTTNAARLGLWCLCRRNRFHVEQCSGVPGEEQISGPGALWVTTAGARLGS